MNIGITLPRNGAPPPPPGCYTPREAAALIGLTPDAIRHQRAIGQGPPVVRVSRWIYYPKADFDAWRASRQERSRV
jgi:hypothetical protein